MRSSSSRSSSSRAPARHKDDIDAAAQDQARLLGRERRTGLSLGDNEMPDSSTISSRRRRARSWSPAATMRRSAAPATPMWSSRTTMAKTCPRRWRMRRRTSMAEDLSRIQAMYLTGFILELTTVGTIVKNSRWPRTKRRMEKQMGVTRGTAASTMMICSVPLPCSIWEDAGIAVASRSMYLLFAATRTPRRRSGQPLHQGVSLYWACFSGKWNPRRVLTFWGVHKEGQSGFVKEGAGHGEDPAGIISSMVA